MSGAQAEATAPESPEKDQIVLTLEAGHKKMENMKNALHRSLAVISSIQEDLNKLNEHYQKLMAEQKQ